LNIVVCIKQVPATTEVRIHSETHTLIRDGVESIINPLDMYAVEEALRIKERCGGKVTVFTMGPPQAEAALRETVSYGVDEVALVSDRALVGSDTLATAYALAKGIAKIGAYDLILCGKQATDGDTAQVGPEVAERLGIPYVAWVRKVEEIGDGKIRVQRMMDDGYEVIEMPLPALITVVKEINEPRLASLKGKLRAKKLEIPMWSAEDIGAEEDQVGLKGSPTQVMRVFSPEPRGAGERFEGDAEDVAERLAERLKEMGMA
jgi:electron transfer flavoprotein beta subunit